MDRIGVCVSAACGVHCALMGVALVVWPTLWLQQTRFGVDLRWLVILEMTLAVLALLFALTALGLGTLRHGRWRPWAFGLPGLTLVCSGVFTPLHDEPLLGSAVVLGGGLLIVLAHVENLRAGRRHRAAKPTAAV